MDHFDQAIYGFQKLQEQGVISLKINLFSNIDIPFSNVFCCQANGKKIFYDLSDGTENMDLEKAKAFLQQHDAVIFKRAYDEYLYGNEQRFLPYGLNYIALYPFHIKVLRKILRDRFNIPYQQLLPVAEHCWSMKRPSMQYNNQVLYTTRLWNDQDESLMKNGST